MKHTPTPWAYGGPYSRAIYGNDGKEIAKMHTRPFPFPSDEQEWRANAEFIVRACNNFDELLEACQTILKRLEFKNTDEVKYYSKDDTHWIKKAKDAIAKAEGR